MKIKIKTNKKIAQELVTYIQQQQRGMEPEVQMEGQDTLVVVDVDKEEDLSKIKRKYKLLKAAHAVESGADKVVGATDETLRFVTDQIVAPIVKTGVKTAGGLIKATARIITTTGSIVTAEVVNTAKEIKGDKELSFAGLRNRKKKEKDDFIIEE